MSPVAKEAVGIDKLALYAGQLSLDLEMLATERGESAAYVRDELMAAQRSVYPPWEDAVTLAVNAARRVLEPADVEAIELLIVATETAVDWAKPVSTWVHRFCELLPACRNFEVKHACYGATAAVKMAAHWVVSQTRPGKKALVISTDLSRPFLVDEPAFGRDVGGDAAIVLAAGGHSPEFILGGCAVAMVIGAAPSICAIDLEHAGYWTQEVADTFRPTSRSEAGDHQLSLYAYLDALDGAFELYRRHRGELDLRTNFVRHIYHAPFPAMTALAHRTLLAQYDVDKRAAQEHFERAVSDGICYLRKSGTAYGASNFVSLLGILNKGQDLRVGDEISCFAYGSGCQGEFSGLTLAAGAETMAGDSEIERHLEGRRALTVVDYEALERQRHELIGVRAGESGIDRSVLFATTYAERDLLVLDHIDNYRRHYRWS